MSWQRALIELYWMDWNAWIRLGNSPHAYHSSGLLQDDKWSQQRLEEHGLQTLFSTKKVKIGFRDNGHREKQSPAADRAAFTMRSATKKNWQRQQWTHSGQLNAFTSLMSLDKYRSKSQWPNKHVGAILGELVRPDTAFVSFDLFPNGRENRKYSKILSFSFSMTTKEPFCRCITEQHVYSHR